MFEICQTLKRGFFILLVLQTVRHYPPSRLCRLMCGRSLTFRQHLFVSFWGLGRRIQGAAKKQKERHRKGIAFPHIKRQSRVHMLPRIQIDVFQHHVPIQRQRIHQRARHV